MPEEGKADEVVSAQRTEELAEPTTEPSTDEASGNATGNTSLDYDELLPKVDPNNKRGGLSRKQAALAKAEKQVETEEEPDKIDILLDEVTSLKAQINGQSSRKSAEKEFDQALNLAGVDVSTFNSEFKGDYLSELDSLVADGINVEKASKLALKMVLPKAQAKEAENRSSGRIRSTLPPTSQPQTRTVYKEADVLKLLSTDTAKYKELMNKRDKGEIQIT